MKFNINKYGVILFALAGSIAILSILKIITVKLTLLAGIALIVYSVPLFYLAMENSRRSRIMVSVSSFLAGIIFLLISRFEILNPVKIIFPSLLFITGMAFIFLFVDNRKEKVFLHAGLFASGAGLLVIIFYKHLPFIYFAERITYILSDYWHILAVGMGLFLLINRGRK